MRALALTLVIVAAACFGALPGTRPEVAVAAGQKVAIIVGPVGGLTSSYRSSANRVADAAIAAGATVAKAYSPNATWGKVRSAVDGANVIVYYGHGNGFPNPYSSTESRDRVNGWGLNRTTSNGDSDNWSTTLVYCGEKALLGTLSASDGAAQRQYCANGPINPAPGFTMVYAQAHYAPGFGERYSESDPIPTRSQAQQRVRNYSYPMLKLGAGAYIATAYSDAHEIVTRVLTQPSKSYGDIFKAGDGYAASKIVAMNHPDVAGAKVWVQKTTIPGFHFGDADYWYAFAGDPNRMPGGGDGGPFSDIAGSPFYDDIIWLLDNEITEGCGGGRFCPDAAVRRGQMASFLARALNLPPAQEDYFSDDSGSVHEANINRIAEAGISGGCGGGRFCPAAPVFRDQMASFMSRALSFAATGTDFFVDDSGSMHEPNINRVAAEGVTNGCATQLYCPAGTVTRGQMAAFLHRALT